MPPCIPNLQKESIRRDMKLAAIHFTHTDVMSISDKKLEFELNSTQRVIQGITGHSVIMFRPPFLSLNEGPR